MKKLKMLVLPLALCLALAACSPNQAKPPALTPEASPEPGQTGEPSQSPEPSKEDELLAFEGAHIEAADYELKKLLELVRPFNVCPEEFDDPSQLSDAALFFAAVTRLNGEFQPLDDGFTYSLPIQELAPAIRHVFGSSAALSESWEGGSYEPYSVDSASGTVLKYSLGQITSLDFTYACVKTPDGWELWLLDLYDPLFADVNSAVIDSGDASAVEWDMVAPYAAEMQTGIYTIKTKPDGGYYLAGFRYRNFKDVAHFSY